MSEKPSYEALKKRIEELEHRIELAEMNELFLRKSQEMGKLGHFSYDPDTGAVEGSSQLFKIFGVDTEESLFDAFAEAVHPEDRHLILPRIERAVQEGVPYDVEHRIRHGNGNVLHVHAKGELVETPLGKRMVGAVQDITQRRLAEEDLAEIYAMSLDMICIADIETASFIKVNPAFTKTLGYTTEELLEKSFIEFIHPDDIESTRSIVEEELRSGKIVVNFENRYRCKDGGYRWLSWVSHPIPEKGITYAVARDITDYKAFEKEQEAIQQELLKRNKFIEMILDSLPIGLGVNNIDTGEVTYLNKKFEEIYGWPADEFTNVAYFFDKVFPDPDERAIQRKRIVEDMVSGDPERMAWEDLEITTKSGQKRVVFAKNIPIFDQNLMISTVQDITEKRRLEAQVQQAQKMDALGTLSSGIAHDFNNILAAIMGYSELALAELPPDSQNVRHDINGITKAALKARNLVRQILTFSRAVEGQKRPLSLNQVVAESMNILSRTLPKMVKVELDLQEGLLPVQADPHQMEQVFINLASNAADAMEDGGKITITTRNLDPERQGCALCGEDMPGRHVRITVSDNGVGISPEVRTKIFEPFFTTKGVGKGTGLGLSTVYGIVTGHGGHVCYQSRLGEGTDFMIHLPVAFAEIKETVSGTVDGAINLRGSGTILVADDEEAVREIAESILTNSGYKVVLAANGEEALEVYQKRSQEIDLVLLDLGMPGMGGKACLAEIISFDPAVRVLITSGYIQYELTDELQSLGATGMVSKPYRMADILQAVKEALGQ